MSMSETLDLVKKSLNTPIDVDTVSKAITVATGIVNYDLTGLVATYPFVEDMTMLGDEIPRVNANGDTATRWKAITGINTGNTHPGVSEGNRGASITTTTAPFSVNYVGLGLEDSVTFEADYASDGYDDAKARATIGLYRSFRIQEEGMLFGGNASLALGTTPTPTLSMTAGSATLPTLTYSVICVALTHQGNSRSSLANGVVGQISKTNTDASSDTINGGAAQKSAAATQAITLGQILNCSVTAVEGAVSYAWFVGAAGAEKLEAITSINSITFTAPLNGTRQAASALTAADYSKDGTYNFDGMLTWARSANNALVKALATGTVGTGTGLTSDGQGGVQEINDLLQNMYDTSRMSPTDILLSSTGIRTVNKLCLANGGAPLFRFVMDSKGGEPGLVGGGGTIGSYLNPITNKLIRVRVHPNAVAGTILGYSRTIPYPLNGTQNLFQIKARKGLYTTQWPFRSRKFEFGIYADEMLQHFAPFTTLKLYNVSNA